MRSKMSALLIVTLIAGQTSLAAFANPLPTNPDDYDVPKYQRLFEQATANADAEDRRITALEGLAQRAQEALNVRQGRVNDLTARLSAGQSELANLQRSDQDLEAEANRLGASLSQLSSQLDSATAEQRNAESALSQIQGQLDAANRAVAEKQNAYDAKNRELQPLDDQIRIKQGTLDTARTSLSATRSRLASANAEKPGLVAKLSQLQSRESALGGEISKAESDLATATSDTEKAQQAVVSTGVSLRNAEQALAAAKAANKPADQIARLQSNVTAAESAAQSARSAFAEASKRKTDASAAVSRGQSELASVHAQIPQTQSRIAELTAQIERDTTAASTLESQVTTLSSDVADLKSRSDSLRTEVARLKADLDRARADTDGVRSRAAQLQTNLANARQRVASLQSSLDSAKNQIAQNRAKIDQNRTKIGSLQATIPALQRDRDDAASGLDADRRAADAATAAVLDQRNRVRDAKVIEQQARTRLGQVQTNLQNGIATAERDGARDGREAAGREGEIRGTEAGNRDGAVAGNREGDAAGRAEGVRAAQTNGARDGNVRGAADGSAKGSAEGQTRGESEGTRVGNADGIQAGQSQGTAKGESEGYNEGVRVGHTQGSYDRGYAEGLRSGKARGEREGAAKGSEDGTKLADREALGAKLTPVTIPMAAPARLGLVGSNLLAQSEEFAAVTAFSPLNGHYPIPELDRRYDAAYRQTYQEVYDRQYQAAAAVAYDRAYRQTYQGAYDRAARADYTAEYQTAYQTSYASAEDAAYRRALDAAYKSSYDSAYQREYQRVFNGTYQTAYQAAYQAAYARGAADANAADLEAGRKVGEAKGYTTAYNASYAQAKASAYAAEKAVYDSSAVLQLQNAVAVDANHDNVNVPGETILLNVGVKNFGRVPSGANVRVELSAATSGLEITVPITTLPVLPATSNVLLSEISALRVRPLAAIGSKESVVVTLTAGGQVLGSSKVELTVGTTLSLSIVEVPAKVLPNVENSLRIVVKNLSTKAAVAEARVEIVSADGLSVISTGTISLGLLRGSEAKEVKSSFRFVDAPEPEKLGIQVAIRVGDATYDTKTVNVKSAERYAYNANSRGLLVVNSLDVAGLAQQARKSAGIGLDLYDERLEGAMSATTAAKYATKLILVPEAIALNANTISSLRAAIGKGANLLVGLDDKSVKTDIGAAAVALAKKNPTRDLLGLKLSERNDFKKSASSTKVLLANPASTIGVDGLANAILIGDSVGKPAAEKAKGLLAAVVAHDARAAGLLQGALVSELEQEMLDDVIVDGKNFEKNPSKLRLTQVTTMLQSATPAERKILGGLHAALESTRAALTGRPERRDALLTLLAPLKAAAAGN